MSTCYGDPVLDFDLNFLRPSPSSTVANSKADKQRRAILIVKKKTIATDSLIKKYYAKREALDQTEKNLLSAKEECKQICIDYRKSVDTCSNLEKDLLQLRSTNKDLELKYFNLESQFLAVNSHANQLQTLVKEHETIIEALKIENKLSKSNDKDHKKMLQPLQKENTRLIRHICLARDIIFGKIKCRLHHKTLLKKYDKYKSPDKDSLFGEEESNDDSASDEIPLSPFSEEYVDDAESLKSNKTQTMNVNINHTNIAENNMSSTNIAECNDVASVDTGRGSTLSLAFSVSDKSFHSPDYFINDSPLSDGSEFNKVKTKLVDSATSPVPFCVAINVSTSPLIFENNLLKNNYNMIDRALSPIILPAETNDVNAVTNKIDDVCLSINTHKTQENSEDYKKSHESDKNQKERECLELNNSDNISNENSHDGEIEMILSTMRLHNELITPIPATPAKPTSTENIHVMPNKHQEHSSRVICPEAVLAREENKKLEASVSELAKELFNIKNMLINRPITVHNTEKCMLNNNSIVGGSINHVKNFQSLPIDIPSHNTKESTLCGLQIPSLNSNRTSVNVNELESLPTMISNNDKFNTIPEGEDNCRDTFILPCEDVTASLNEKDIEITDVSEENVTNSVVAGNKSTESQSFTRDDHYKLKLVKRKQVTKLGKLKQRLLPKYKIKMEHLPLKRKSVKLKEVIKPSKKKVITANDSSATLNSKNVYEKAVKVMADLKCKKSICIENESLNLNEKNVPERNHLCEAKYNESEQEERCKLISQPSNPIQIPSIGTRSCSKSTALTDINDELRVDNLETNTFKTICFDDNHENAVKELSISPEFKQHLKRTCANFTSDIPCKRVLRSTTLDNCKGMNPRIILHNCEDLLRSNCRNSTDETAKNILHTINISPNNRKSPSKKNDDVISSPEVSPKTAECQEKLQNIVNEQQNNVKDVSSSEIGNRNFIGLTSNKKKSTKDMFSPEVSPKKIDSPGRNVIPSITSNRRKSVRVLSFPESPSSSLEVPENQEGNSNQDLPNQQRKNIKDICPPPVCPKALHFHENNDNQNYENNERKSIKEIVSSQVSPKQQSNSLEICNKRRKVGTCFQEISANAQEHQESSFYQHITTNPRESVLCQMITQYGVKSVKFRAKKVSDSVANSTAKKLEDDIARIIELPTNDSKEAMNKFVLDIQHWDIKHFLAGLIKYLKDPTRKIELFNKVAATSAPALTKSEQILLYVISELRTCWYPVDIIDKILNCMEYTLFSLNRTPPIEVIESMSHFYAVLCRYFKMKTRLRLFILDAMYCIQYKAVPLIRQCIDVWMHILPLAHMSSAQSPLVTCLVYLLHFYKCEDKLNRVQDIRNILNRKYFYKVTEWNETKILELFRNSIKDLRGSPAETKMLRIALIILAKRHGPRWCQNNIVKNLLQPMIEKQNNTDHVKAFCVSMLGPLLKPFPADMKVHCEIVMNQLITMLQENTSPKIAEAVVTSLIYINRHNQFRVIQALAVWRPLNLSPELQDMLKDFVRTKPLKIWKSTLAKAIQ